MRHPRYFFIALLLVCLGSFNQAAQAEDRADIDRTKIIGNKELPKVLYIVPWKKPVPGELAGRPLVSVLDEKLAPIDRDVVRRQVKYEGQNNAQIKAQIAKKSADKVDAAANTSPNAPANTSAKSSDATSQATNTSNASNNGNNSNTSKNETK